MFTCNRFIVIFNVNKYIFNFSVLIPSMINNEIYNSNNHKVILDSSETILNSQNHGSKRYYVRK